MPQRCRICAHPELNAIESGLRDKVSISELARRFDLTRFTLMRHRADHVTTVIVPLSREKRGQRLKHIETDAKDHFLTAYATNGDFLGSALAAGVTRGTIQTWLEHDDEFTLRFHQAKAAVVDQLEATALDRAMHGAKRVREVWRGDRMIERIIEWAPQETILVKLLQALRPEVYAEKLQVTQTQIVKTVDADAWVAV